MAKVSSFLTLCSVCFMLALVGCNRKCDDKCEACFNACAKGPQGCKVTFEQCHATAGIDKTALEACAHQFKACEEGCLAKCAPPAQ
ncbi:hypothetical protein Bealeia1_01738 [Candidatus Bealeia paramacronuclearis]|uniref:Four-helix bundle copper-binding protein n=1 Tax=Candidatus Bealeia paramacronuclearis TaxID=1921001 RepID=A0ABZ2C536_9PROT|nr:hypothetical protein [Candidatus Bealeia paramacronuclearis]